MRQRKVKIMAKIISKGLLKKDSKMVLQTSLVAPIMVFPKKKQKSLFGHYQTTIKSSGLED